MKPSNFMIAVAYLTRIEVGGKKLVGLWALLVIAGSAQAQTQSLPAVHDSIPVIAEGSPYQARYISAFRNKIVLSVVGREDEKFSAKEYAEIFYGFFKDPEISDYPSEIIVRYLESGEAGHTTFMVFINERIFDQNGGFLEGDDGVFNSAQLVLYLPMVTQEYDRIF